jgi:hypothetical protein
MEKIKSNAPVEIIKLMLNSDVQLKPRMWEKS